MIKINSSMVKKMCLNDTKFSVITKFLLLVP